MAFLNPSAVYWQARQLWSYLRHAYRCGWQEYADVAELWPHRKYALAYTVAQVRPRSASYRCRY